MVLCTLFPQALQSENEVQPLDPTDLVDTFFSKFSGLVSGCPELEGFFCCCR